jgi:hypothetical protein
VILSRGLSSLGVLTVALFPALALADDPKVDVMADVILASNDGTTMDPPSLAKMKDEFDSAGIKFTSFKRLSTQKLTVTKQPSELKLPNKKIATLKLEGIKEGTATIRVKGVAESTIQLGRSGNVSQPVGAHQGGQLILMLAPVDASAKPRRSGPLSHPATPVHEFPKENQSR